MLYTVCGSVIRSKPLPALAGRGVGCGRVVYLCPQYPYSDSWFCVGRPLSSQEFCESKENKRILKK